MGWPNFQPGDIYKPYLNVKFGTYYLKAALDMFDGNPYPALVGYNAGPGNARFWLEEAPPTTMTSTWRRSAWPSRSCTCAGCWRTTPTTCGCIATLAHEAYV